MSSRIIIGAVLFSFLARAADVALYWGQATFETLASTCASEEADIIILTFLNQFGNGGGTVEDLIILDLSANCLEQEYFPDGLVHCPSVAADIKTCQQNGKKVMLSLGGPSLSYGFDDDAAGEAFATTLWNMFGNGQGSEERPFDDVILDGFDFYIETDSQTGYAACANKLKSYFDSDSSKEYYLSASPGCSDPFSGSDSIITQAYLDFAFITFYNNPCSFFKSWLGWTQLAQGSFNENIKLYLGLSGSPLATDYGYADVDEVKSIVQQILSMPDAGNFGGIAIWDALWSQMNQVNDKSYANNMQDILNELVDPATTSSTSTASTSITSTTATPTSAYVDCSGLSGLDKAECMNNNFDNGLYLGSADSCAINGEIACTPDHQFAICDYGEWVVMECAPGTSCYAFNFHGVDEVTVGCNFTDDMDEYEDDENENENAEVQPLKKMKRSRGH